MVGSRWTKVKLALGLKGGSCIYVPGAVEDFPAPALEPSSARSSDAPTLSPRDSRHRLKMPTTPMPSSSGLLLPKHSSKSSKMICAICLNTVKPGQGHAIFTAECSHSFHFHCIASNVMHGKHNCPVCRAKWKEVPFQSPITDKPHGGDDPWTMTRRPPRVDIARNISMHFRTAEPDLFDDDDELTSQPPDASTDSSTVGNMDDSGSTEAVEVKTYTEVSAVPNLTSRDDFSVLIHLKAPVATPFQYGKIDEASFTSSSQTRASVDLVTVLDVSGSMTGTKLALLKWAMGFVIQSLGPSDRLSVIAFSSTARRLFPLRRMTAIGRDEAVQAVNSLRSNGGTNIAEGLRKGAKVITDRKWKNPVGSIILLSDGQDTYAVNGPSGGSYPDYRSLLPLSMHRDSSSGLHVPVHAFGFGADHDAVSMHAISETSGGTFSFIEAESVIQDAFAQCIGGLLSVVVQGLKVEVECVDDMVQLNSVKSGSYKATLTSDKRKGSIEVGDLYAEEERDFLVTIDIPLDEGDGETSLLKVRCDYKNPVTNNVVTLSPAHDVRIRRPLEETGPLAVSMEVDKQRNRLRSAKAMAEAGAAAEQGDLASAISVLESCRERLSGTVSAQAGDRLCAVLDAELREMQERMANRQVYETSGRAYVLSGLSSHSWQRATARGDSTSSTSLVQAYQTPTMVDMVNFSQTMVFNNPSSRPKIRHTLSFPARPQPR